MLTRKPEGAQPVRYEYDGANRLMGVDEGARSISYIYDSRGKLYQRTTSQVNGSAVERYRYADNGILSIVNDQGDVSALYTLADDGRLLRRRTSQRLDPPPSLDPHSVFYLHDGMRSICRGIDWDGTARLSADFDAWGLATVDGEVSLPDAFRFHQTYSDPATGLLHFGVRWYDPDLGRWISEDPLV